ncbi:putative F420-dependent oxidoreductase, MSMEG_2249 family [Actinobacteria bacterium IMCC26207]|nr:putative F420-dependent oxidoreductase, MSMEG_2249 family [Actinobacteria bacterium IMCC26207]
MTPNDSSNPTNAATPATRADSQAQQSQQAQCCELGFYTLAGHSGTPRDLITECHAAESLGLGTAFISERFNTKDATALSGAAGAVSTTLGIATAATNHNTRHPLVTATFAMTMHRLTEGRFALGLGRGFDALFDIMGLPHITMAQMADAIDLYRRLWRGEMVFGHDGPAGNFPMLCLDPSFDEKIPVMLTAIGERTLEFAGSLADGVILHTFFADDALERSVAAVRRGAEQAGRDPGSIRIWSVLATVGDHLDEELRLKKLVGRLATYLQGYGDLLVSVNNWDPQVLARFRADDVVGSIGGAIDAIATLEQLEHIAKLFPEEWLQAAATGTADQCAARVLAQFDLGADGVILHGATPTELAPVVSAYRGLRPPNRFDTQLANPGWAQT